MLPRIILLLLTILDNLNAQPAGFQGQQQFNQQLGPGQQQQFVPQQQQQQTGQLFPQAPPPFGQQQAPLGSQAGAGGFMGQQQGVGMGGVPMGAGVKLVQDLMQFDRAMPTPELQWMEPFSSQIYCVGQPPVQELRFVCGTCNLVYNTTTSSFQPMNNNFGPNQNVQMGLQQQQQQPQPQLGMGFAALFNQQQQQQQNQIDQMLAQYTKDLSAQAQYPAIKLGQMPISGEMWDKQRLQCIGFYPAASGSVQQSTISSYERPNVTADALVTVIYVGKPQILDQMDRRPIFSAIGQPGRFYAPQNTVASLKCAVRANPPATMFEWRMGTTVVGRNQMLQVPGQNLVPMSLSCRATNAGGQQQQQQINWQSSDEVIVEQLIGPVAENNFDSVMRSSLKDANTGKVAIGQRASLQCKAASSSKPFVLWLHQPSQGHILNASCDGGAQTTGETPVQIPLQQQQQGMQQQQGQAQQQQLQQRPGLNLVSVTSTCSLTFDSFIKAGDYWCLACSYIAENATACNIQNTNMAPPGATANFELQGPPYLSPYFKVERFPNSKQVALTFTFCGDPLPKQDEVFFTLDNDPLKFNSHYKSGGVHASAPVQNQTYSHCQDVQLTLDSSSAASKFRTLALNVEPADKMYPPIRQQYYIQDAVTNPGQSAYDSAPFDATALAIGLALGFVVLVLLLVCAYCWYKKMCIFAPRRPNKTTKMGTTGSTGPGSKPARYQAGIPSSQLRPDVSREKSVPLTRTNNGLEQRPSKTPHEGMTYSEFDLVKDSNRLVPSSSGPRQVEYSRMPQSSNILNPSSIKSPTNSIV